jgi:ATP-dependent DNA helicase PIF1
LCEEIARIVRKSDKPFGGIQVVFTGDFYQLPPVGNVGDLDTDAFCFESPKWNDVFRPENHVVMETMFRQTDPVYIQLLSEIRRGEISEEGQQILSSKVNLEYHPEDYAGCVLTKLFPVRAKADFVNQAQYAKIDSDEMVFDVQKNLCCGVYVDNGKGLSIEDVDKCVGLSLVEKQQHVDWLIANTNCVDRLCLKRGTAVMCTANIDMDSGICNGSQGIVVDMIKDRPVVLFSNGHRMMMEKTWFQSEIYPTLAIGQYPLSLAWAVTIHKIQGCSLTHAQIDIGESIFEYGQTYVALSRVRTMDGLYLMNFQPKRIKSHPKVIAFYNSL